MSAEDVRIVLALVVMFLFGLFVGWANFKDDGP